MRGKLSHPVVGYHLVVHLIVCAALAGAALFVALTVNRSSERKFCDLVLTQLAAYAEAPPSTDTGKKLMEKYKILKTDLGCQEARS